jgi:hypothetical protein
MRFDETMKPKLILLGLALVLSGCSTAPPGTTAGENSWQTTLRAAVTNSVFPPGGSVGIMFYTVPADAAEILESQPPAELMPFLVKLRSSQSSWQIGTIDEWLIIVRDGLRGTPGIITNTLTTAKGAVVSTTEIPVYTYADHFLPHAH